MVDSNGHNLLRPPRIGVVNSTWGTSNLMHISLFFFGCCDERRLLFWWLQPKKSRGENVFTFKKFCQGGKGEILMHSWILTIVARCFNKGLELPLSHSWLLTQVPRVVRFIYVTWLCLGGGCGVAAIFRVLLLERHTFEQGITFPRGDAFPSQLLYIFLHDDVTYGSGYIQVIVDRWMLSLLLDSTPTYRAKPVPVVAQWLCPHTATSKE